MGKLKGILEGLLYLLVIFLIQKIIYDTLSNSVFYLLSTNKRWLPLSVYSETLSIEEQAMQLVQYAQPMCMVLAWLIGIGIILLALKASKQDLFPIFKLKISLLYALLSVIVGFGLVLLTNGILNGLGPYIMNTTLPIREATAYEGGLFTILLLTLVIPFLEEVVFRGYIMGRLFQVGTVWFAIIIQGLLFSISHFDMFQGAAVFILGIGAGYMVIKSQSIMSGVIIHGIFNLTSLYLYPGEYQSYDFMQMLLFVVIGLILTFFGLFQMNKSTA